MDFRGFNRGRYKTANGGWVELKQSDVQSVQPRYENTLVVLTNGVRYLLQGRDYGV